MIIHTLSNSDGTKTIEVAGSANDLGIRLRHADESGLYAELKLNDMLVYSVGRPWRRETKPLANGRVEAAPGEIRIHGRVGELAVQIRLSFDREDLLTWDVTWTNESGAGLADAAVGLQFPLARKQQEKVTIPHMIYNNNPSADPERPVPRLGIGEGKGFITEEHRLPIPCVNVEWVEDRTPRYMTFFSIPQYVELEGDIQYGSMGAVQTEEQFIPVFMSGVLMFNGEPDVTYVSKSVTAPTDGGYLDMPPQFVLRKTYVLDWGKLARAGWGFRETVRAGTRLFRPFEHAAKPLSLNEIILLKTNAMDDRWRNVDGAAGYIKFNDSNSFGKVNKHPFHFLYGWTGHSLLLSWCDAHVGLDANQPDRIERCRQAVDFYLKESGTGVPGLHASSYILETKQWTHFNFDKQPVVSSRAYGETIATLADIILLFRERGLNVPPHWIEGLREAADFILSAALPSGIYPVAWLLDGKPADDMITAAGIPCVMAIAKAYRVLGEPKYLEQAEQVMRRYYELHAETFDRPFARSTLDAKCEDKEAGMYYFLAAYELFMITDKPEYREWAETAADWILTYVYVWNPVFKPGTRFHEYGFRCVGWPGVSVQNHHLDVYFPSYELTKLGEKTGNEFYARMGRTVLNAMGQGICRKPGDWGFTVVGEQSEAFFQTNWQNFGSNNRWNPSWVIALVLSHALKFRAAGHQP